jgi:hypothetical protein
MFNTKKCPRCSELIKSSFDFCPNCGKQLRKQNKEDWGMLGKDDLMENSDPFSNSIFGGITGGILGKMLGTTMKMLEKELQKEIQNPQSNSLNSNFELFINGKKINPKNIKVSKRNSNQQPKKSHQQTKQITLPENKLKNFAELPKEEPKTIVRRLSDKIIYQIEIPGVKSERDISIRTISETIEIRAITKNKAYEKTISIGLPIINYIFEKDLLILELEAKN